MAPPEKRRPSKTSRDDDNDIRIEGVKSHDTLRPRSRSDAGRSKYDELCDKAVLLEPGQVLEVSISEEADPVKTRNRISVAIRRYAKPHTPHALKIRLTENDTVGIYCYEADAADEDD